MESFHNIRQIKDSVVGSWKGSSPKVLGQPQSVGLKYPLPPKSTIFRQESADRPFVKFINLSLIEVVKGKSEVDRVRMEKRDGDKIF